MTSPTAGDPDQHVDDHQIVKPAEIRALQLPLAYISSDRHERAPAAAMNSG